MNTDYNDEANAGDTAQKLDAMREWMGEINEIANTDMDTIRNLDNFYSFDQQCAKEEIAYRQALKKELDGYSSNISRLSSLPRKN